MSSVKNPHHIRVGVSCKGQTYLDIVAIIKVMNVSVRERLGKIGEAPLYLSSTTFPIEKGTQLYNLGVATYREPL